MPNNFPVPPVPVASTIKKLYDQVKACQQWLDATERHTVTIVFFAKVNGFETTNLVKLDDEMFSNLAPDTCKLLDDFFQNVADDLASKKILLQQQEHANALLNMHTSFKKHR